MRNIFFLFLTGTAARCSRCIHAGILKYLDELAAKCADVLLDLVHVVLRDALVFRLTLFDGDVSSYQISHDTLIPKVSLGGLLDFSLRQENQKSKPFNVRRFRYKVHITLCTACPKFVKLLYYLDSLTKMRILELLF